MTCDATGIFSRIPEAPVLVTPYLFVWAFAAARGSGGFFVVMERAKAVSRYEARMISRDDAGYPLLLRQRLGAKAGRELHFIGDERLLHLPMLAFLCSAGCPGVVAYRALEVVRSLRDAGVPVSGGFHAPLEARCLELLLEGEQPVVLGAAAGVSHVALDRPMRKAIRDGRLLVVSLVSDRAKRRTRERAVARNELVSALADSLFVPWAAPGGKVSRSAWAALDRGRAVYTIADESNLGLLARGARPIETWTVAPTRFVQ